MNKLALIVGHSEQKQGAVNKDSGVTEWEWNCRLVEAIYFGVSDRWIDVGLWPDPPENRIPISREHVDSFPIKIFYRTHGIKDLVNRINEWNPDLAIEFHLNSSSPCASGTEMLLSKSHFNSYAEPTEFHVDVNSLNLRIAETVGIPIRHTKFRGRWQRGGYFLNKTNCRAIIAETFFICNNSDLAKANENYDELAKAYVDWIVNYFKEV